MSLPNFALDTRFIFFVYRHNTIKVKELGFFLISYSFFFFAIFHFLHEPRTTITTILFDKKIIFQPPSNRLLYSKHNFSFENYGNSDQLCDKNIQHEKKTEENV